MLRDVPVTTFFLLPDLLQSPLTEEPEGGYKQA